MKRITLTVLTSMLMLTGLEPTLGATSTPKLKCSGSSLSAYNKNLRIYNSAYEEYQKWNNLSQTDPTDYPYSNPQIRDIITSDYKIWLYDGYALAKYAKICKVPMPQEWQDMLNSLPAQ